jgi:hypothetical protein
MLPFGTLWVFKADSHIMEEVVKIVYVEKNEN